VEELKKFGRHHGIDEMDLFRVRLALEECGSNIVDYALRRDCNKTFTVTIGLSGQNLTVELRDSGPEFDPTKFSKVRNHENDAAVGGWGLELVRRYMDEVRYRREGSENILMLTKIVQTGQHSTKPETLKH
jgi:anti-sigma regulatory factor (Ser/Thr protein kinase)